MIHPRRSCRPISVLNRALILIRARYRRVALSFSVVLKYTAYGYSRVV
jgi:hypothetical protein